MPFLLLFYEYFKIGLFTIGGGYAMLPMVMQVISTRGWIPNDQLLNFIGIAESTPGPFAINLATFVGLEVGKSTSLGIFGGILGSIVATIAVVLPSLIVIIIVTKLLNKFNSNRYVQGAIAGVRPVVVGLVLSAFVTIATAVVLPNVNFKQLSTSNVDTFNYVSLIIFAVMLALSNIKIRGRKIHPIILIVSSAVIGIVLFGAIGTHL